MHPMFEQSMRRNIGATPDEPLVCINGNVWTTERNFRRNQLRSKLKLACVFAMFAAALAILIICG